MSLRHLVLATAALAAVTSMPLAAKNPMVGGAAMYPTKNIVENAVNSKDHTTLVAAVKAAGLVETLVKPENKGTLTTILTYHVVPGRITAGQIQSMAARHKGVATLKTVQGGTLKFRKRGSGWTVTDAKGGSARITIANVMQSNGVIHVIDGVLMP